MANVRNYEEYRAEVLDTLGATVEDLRNEPSFRTKVLETLGVEFTDEDTRNFERYRLKALEGLKNGGGGGGSSDFSIANVTVINKASNTFQLLMPNIFGNKMYAITNSEEFESGDVLQVPLYKGSIEALSLTSDAKLRITGEGNVITSVKGDVIGITGDCTITIS